jgi:hypothetical protein
VEKDPHVVVNTKVKYGERLAGCMAIAAVHETAERLGKGWEEARGFLRTRHMWAPPWEARMIKRMQYVCFETWKVS